MGTNSDEHVDPRPRPRRERHPGSTQARSSRTGARLADDEAQLAFAAASLAAVADVLALKTLRASRRMPPATGSWPAC